MFATFFSGDVNVQLTCKHPLHTLLLFGSRLGPVLQQFQNLGQRAPLYPASKTIALLCALHAHTTPLRNFACDWVATPKSHW